MLFSTRSWGVSLVLCINSLASQCNPVVSAIGGAVPGASGNVHTTALWDPDGPGPLGEQVLVGGEFDVFGDQLAYGLASYDPVTGNVTTFGGGLGGWVRKAIPLQNGGIAAYGNTVPGVISIWDGTSWQAIGTPGIYQLSALAEMPNGDIVVGGFFNSISGTTAANIARWDGSTWQALGTGVDSSVLGLAVLPNGELLTAGTFDNAGSIAAKSIARWDGSAWHAVGPGTSTGLGVSLQVLQNGDWLLGGSFSSIGGVGAANIARWDGTAWHPLGAGTPQTVYAMLEMSNGDIFANYPVPGLFGSTTPGVGRWDGTTWQLLDPGMSGDVRTMTRIVNDGVIAGDLQSSTNGALNIARWDGSTWQALFPGLSGSVSGVLRLPNGEIIVHGNMQVAGVPNTQYIARYDGANWHALGSGVDRPVNDTVRLPNGDIVAGGSFLNAGGLAVRKIARWDGNAWHALGTGIGGPGFFSLDNVQSMAVLPNGDLIVGGYFFEAGGVPVQRVARWDGSSWSAFGAISNTTVSAMTVTSTGELLVGGSTSAFGGSVLRWDGMAWVGVGLIDDVYDLAELPNGDLVACGGFQWASGIMASRVARWDGTSWGPMGSGLPGPVHAVEILPNGDVLAGGNFNSGGFERLARWDGVGWTPILGTDQAVYDLALDEAGVIWAAGKFQRVDAAISPAMAQLLTTCPPSLNSYGTACASSVGPALLDANEPYVGSSWQTTGTNLPAQALVLAVAGLNSVSVPLAPVLPAAANCDLLVAPDTLELVTPNAGVAQWTLPIPPTIGLVGQSLYHQLVSLEVDAQFNITQVSSSNALSASIGAW